MIYLIVLILKLEMKQQGIDKIARIWSACHRELHLRGGLSAVNSPSSNKIICWPRTLDNKIAEIELLEFNQLFYKVHQFGLHVVGAEYISNQFEASGEAPTEWRSYSRQQKIWSNWDASQLWSQLGNSSYHHRNGLCFDLSNRISYQLKSISQRLKELSYSYQDQLNSLLKSPTKDGQRVTNGFTDIVYQKFQSFLFDACILRDYLCEFVYIFSRNGDLREERKEITTAGQLLKLLKKKSDSLNEIESELKLIMEGAGWLKELGAYRDLVMHSAPINIAYSKLYCIQEILDFQEGKQIKSVRFPIPSDPEGIYRERSKRQDFDRYIREIEAIAETSRKEYGKYDCLQYAQTISTSLSNLSLRIATLAPFRPMIQCFSPNSNGPADTGFRYV